MGIGGFVNYSLKRLFSFNSSILAEIINLKVNVTYIVHIGSISSFKRRDWPQYNVRSRNRDSVSSLKPGASNVAEAIFGFTFVLVKLKVPSLTLDLIK